MSAPLDRLRDASGPGGWRRDDVLAVCDDAERGERLRHDARHVVRYLLRAGVSSSSAAVIEMLEDALGEDVR